MFAVYLLLVIAIFSPLAFAKKKIFVGRFGPEFSFGRLDAPFDDKDLAKFRAAAMAHLIEGQPVGEKFEIFVIESRTAFQSPHGWWFTSSKDPHVLEVQMKPMTVEEFKAHDSDMQDAIFVTAANQGYVPFDYLGGGHLNIDIEAFQGNVLLVRNFIVDYWNHNELALGALSYDTNNAMPFSLQGAKYWAEVQERLNKLNSGEYFRMDPEHYLYQFLADLNATRSSSTDSLREYWHGPQPARYKATDMTFYQATKTEKRIEIRAVRPQKSIYRWIKQIELIEARINYLAKFKKPIPLRPIVPIRIPENTTMENLALEPPVDPQEALRSFYNYVTESGLKWQDYREDLWPRWLRLGEVDKFEASDWFIFREAIASADCAQYL